MLTQTLAESYQTMGAEESAGYDVGEAATLEILEGLGHLYGAMGYTMDAGGDFGGAEDGLDDDPDLDDFGDGDDELGITPWQQRMKFFERRGVRGRVSPAKALKKLIKAKKAKGKAKHEGLLRNAPGWLRRDYGLSNKRSKKQLRAAGLNVPDKCPNGSRITIHGKRRDRWLCFNQPDCNKPYVVWDRRKRQWSCKHLNCWSRAKIPCKRDKGFFEKATDAVKKGVSSAVNVVKKAVLAPLQVIKNLAIRVLMQAVLPLAKAMCNIPENVLVGGAIAAGQDPEMFMGKFRMFCRAVRVRNFGDIRKFLPDVIQISVKVAATTSVPGLGPALAIVRRIPGLNIPGLSGTLGAAGAQLGATGADPVELLDSMSTQEIAWALNGLSDAELAAGLRITPKVGTAIGLGVGVAAVVGGLFLTFRER